MSGGIISKKHLDAVNARLEELESNSLAMAKVITRQHQTIGEQQLKIDAMALCLKEELGISVERAQRYRQQVIDERRREHEAAQQAAIDTAHLDAKRGAVVDAPDITTDADGTLHVAGPVRDNAGTADAEGNAVNAA